MPPPCLNILVAEDNKALAKIVRYNLEIAGYDVTVAHDGREAWVTTRSTLFALLITDYNMPRISGADLARRLRDDENYFWTPIILMTEYSRDLHLRRLRAELNLCAIFAKPFSPAELVNSVKQCLATSSKSSVPSVGGASVNY